MVKDLEQVYEGNNMMQSPYLVDRDILYMRYDSVIDIFKENTSIRRDGCESQSVSKLVKAKEPLKNPLPDRIPTKAVRTLRLSVFKPGYYQ